MIFVLLFLIMFGFSSPAAYCADNSPPAESSFVDIRQLAEEYGLKLRFDYWKGIYELSRGNTSVQFSANTPWYLLNHTEVKFGIGVKISSDGYLMIDSLCAEELVQVFASAMPSGQIVQYIVLDPGHGGKDPGAIGRFTDKTGKLQTINEKDVVLYVALQTAALLKEMYPERQILLTREDDRYLKLEERTMIANSVKVADNEAMIFVSFHANASFNTSAKGFEVWYLPQEYRRDVLDPEKHSGVDSSLIPILNTMLEEEYSIESIILCDKILASMEAEVKDYTPNRGSKEESWFVVRDAKMPSVLIELGFVTNNDEAALLSSESYLKKLSQGIYNGIVDFINEYEKVRSRSE